jgi:predicted N-acetyltransferase YhbS
VGPAEQIVAERAGAIVGAVLLLPAGIQTGPPGSTFSLKWPEVRLLAVVPVARGHGVGAALTRECVLRARRAGASAITLHTADIMATAMHLYERLGFVRAPELDFHPVENVTIKGFRFNLV